MSSDFPSRPLYLENNVYKCGYFRKLESIEFCRCGFWPFVSTRTYYQVASKFQEQADLRVQALVCRLMNEMPKPCVGASE